MIKNYALTSAGKAGKSIEKKGKKNKKLTEVSSKNLSQKIIWLDMISPTSKEKHEVEKLLSIEIPTREEMREIEISSRLYWENNTLYITATLVTQVDKDEPETHSVTFIFKKDKIVTLRYFESKVFSIYLGRIAREQINVISKGFQVFLGIMEAVIDHLSDALEMIGSELDKTSKEVFQKVTIKNSASNLEELLQKVGRHGDLNGKLRESLLSLSRVFSYLLLSGGAYKQTHREALESHAKDIGSLTEHATYITSRVNLLLDATLGMISIEQNAIIKIFSVAAVVFLPPTLIASIYGMNFAHMPELTLSMGYPFAVGLMIISAILPYLYFKKKGWL